MTADVPASRELAAIAELAARTTGDRLRTAFRSRPAIDLKLDFHDPVTEHDRAAEETIREVLGEQTPGCVVVGEEGGVQGRDTSVRWYVDPIDGTANFAVGLPFFCTSIAAVADGELVAGVVYDPVHDDMFTASLDGAFCNGEPIRSTGATSDQGAVIATSYPSPHDLAEGDRAETLRRYGDLIGGFATVRRPGSAALTLAHVAAGWTDVAYDSWINAYDIAAGLLLVRQAGGTYLPLRGKPGGDDWDAPGYLACVAGFDLAGSAIAEIADLTAQDCPGDFPPVR
ncbi:inositol monophosphatase [Actinomadura sp. GC306]|uniref:inositol monophosphatase family protein n=1 Tax=Actinomadura sp. GC306 TaxID=2530367 RepID=UPI001047C707|nr:inositol monophosphatase family protein [Actinomadura sp. GC306]TDC63056.1 inositol monophosphatase [Actinomadura sp. GC306]